MTPGAGQEKGKVQPGRIETTLLMLAFHSEGRRNGAGAGYSYEHKVKLITTVLELVRT